MQTRSRLLSFAMTNCLLLTAFVHVSSTESNQPRIHFGKQFFTLSVKNVPQKTGSQRSARRRKRRATAPAANSNASTSAPQPTQTPTRLPTSQGPLSQISYELPIKQPRAGEERMQGLLMRVDCESRGVTFIVGVGDRQLKLRTSNLNLVKFTTYTPEVSGEVTCGARKPANNTVIIYRPAKDASSRFNGELVSVEFVPKDFKLKK
jgi:hypothetical protein